MPLQIGCTVFDYSKLKMYQFCYDWVDKNINRRYFQYEEMNCDEA